MDPPAEMRDEAVLSWLRRQGGAAEYVTSVCTGALILAEAGLLDGYKATVTTGIDFGFSLVAETAGPLTEFFAAKN